MTNDFITRETTPQESAQILALYPLAFPEEDLTQVVSELLKEGPNILSLATFEGEVLTAHILFSICGTEVQDQTGALLGPLGVLPSHQRQGLGNSIVRDGLKRLERNGIKQVFVLGDPNYYQRFGFSTERQAMTPYPLPEEYAEAWQSMSLAARPPLARGRLLLPDPWMKRDLWGP